MTKTFTENDLVRFLYEDLSKKEKAELEQALLTDDSLTMKLRMLEETSGYLSKVSFKAPERTVDRILAYSKSLEAEGI